MPKPNEIHLPARRTADRSDVATATAQLFADIATSSPMPDLADTMLALNSTLAPIRAYETAFIPDLEAEYAELSACWERRDLVGLQRLIAAYFGRRQALVPRIVALIGAPH